MNGSIITKRDYIIYEIFINGSRENAIEIVSPALIHMIEQTIALEY